MAKDFLCIKHDLSFPSEELYKQHKKDTHGQPLPEGVTPEMLPDAEFMKRVQDLESHPINSNPIVESPTLQEKLEPRPSEIPLIVATQLTHSPQPIALTYKYTGTCPDHTGMAVDTLMLTVAKQLIAVAFCNMGKHQLAQMRVAPLTGGES